MNRVYLLIVLTVVAALSIGCSSTPTSTSTLTSTSTSTPTHTVPDTRPLVRCDALFYVESYTYAPGEIQDELRRAALWFRAQYDTNDPTNRLLYEQTLTDQIELYRGGAEYPNHEFMDGCLEYYLLYSGHYDY